MIALEKLTSIQEKNKSLICLGLDIDPQKVPGDLGKTTKGLYDFAARIIDATSDLVCAYKPNIAFYENLGAEGISLLRLLIDRIPDDIPIIIDAKRGDIGNTAAQYAQALYEKLGADWVTLSPYMGYDSIRPFLEYKDKGVFILCLTSNTGAKDFQLLMIDGKPLYQIVAEKVAYWDKEEQCGLVVGATQPEQLKQIRQIANKLPILIPGVGAQGGSLELAVKYGTDNFSQPALINVSRSVLYASNQDDFAARARGELRKLNSLVDSIRQSKPATPEENRASEDTQSGLTVQVEDASVEVTQKQEPINQVDEVTQITIQAPPVHDTDNREEQSSQSKHDENRLPSESNPPVQPAIPQTPAPNQAAPEPINIPSNQPVPESTNTGISTDQTAGENSAPPQSESESDTTNSQPEQRDPEQKREYRGDHRSRRRFNRRNRSRYNNRDQRQDGQSNSQQNSPGQQQNNDGDSSSNQGSENRH